MRHRTVNAPLPAEGASSSEDFDTVADEMSRWATLDHTKIEEFMDSDSIINEFALLYYKHTGAPSRCTTSSSSKCRHTFLTRSTQSSSSRLRVTSQMTTARWTPTASACGSRLQPTARYSCDPRRPSSSATWLSSHQQGWYDGLERRSWPGTRTSTGNRVALRCCLSLDGSLN